LFLVASSTFSQLFFDICYGSFSEMPIYRCVFLNDKAEARAVEAIDAGNLEHAIEVAVEVLNSRRDYLAVEVWRGGQRLYSSKP
jgi:hypothetical protein